MTFARISVGKQGESLATEFLRKNGYRIVENNFRNRYGEIDIIAIEGKTIVFIEVKTKTNSKFGPPKMAVDLRKQRQISKAALAYLTQKRMNNNPARFDVVGISMLENKTEIELIKNAFELHL
ncbi:MAG TPA: YraN family protein [Thermodesulfobacteriota bacterium]|nr:YraN family protein [Thermodesulfobacteriota bacterium]HLA51437.1 YraN family protein [Thermodesulfobacteriota bacterium]